MVDSDSDFKYLRGTKLLTSEEDIASKLVAGVDDFLLRKLTESVGSRSRYWKRDVSSMTAFAESVQPNREVFVWPTPFTERELSNFFTGISTGHCRGSGPDGRGHIMPTWQEHLR